jgi:hypothetical protein
MDRPGIESLYAQIVDNVETSRVTRAQKGASAKGRAGLQLRNLLIKLLSGVECEVSAEVEGSRMYTEESTSVQAIEHKLSKVLAFLAESGDDIFFTDLGNAIRRVRSVGEPVYISVRDKFNAPQFYGCGPGTDIVNTAGHLLLEKGGAMDHDDGDNYYKSPAELVKLSAGIEKMRGSGRMGAASHEAIFLRGHQGRHVPLGVFGTLFSAFDYFQIKPYAIWR